MDFLSVKHVIGIKQTLLQLQEDNCKLIVVATDCDNVFKERIFTQSKGKEVQVLQCYTKVELGQMLKIDVPCGVVSVLKS